MKRHILKNKKNIKPLKPKERLKYKLSLPEKTDKYFISSGIDSLNLALTQDINKGYCVGRIVNIVGDFSSGKCIKNAYILTEQGLIKIDDLFPEVENGLYPYSKTISTINNTKIKTKYFYKEKTNKTIDINTEHGFTLEGTEEHPILIWRDYNFELIKLSDIKLDDYVVIQKGMNFFPLNPYIFSDEEKQKDLNTDPSEINWNAPDIMTNELACFLGYFIADGNFSNNNICISNTKDYVIEEISEICKYLNINYGNNKYITRKQFTNFIRRLFNSPNKFTARYKFVPRCILQSSKKHQANFLRCLIDCDGYLNNNNLYYYTASHELAKQVQLILLNFGIFSGLTYKWNKKYKYNYATITIYSSELQKYSEEIGTQKYEFNNVSIKSMNIIPNLIPKMWEDIENFRESYGWSKNGILKDGRRIPKFKPTKRDGDASYNNIIDFINKFSEFMDISYYKDLLNYHFSKITNININNKETIVYDFTIPTTHLFWSNGMISHNTLLACEAVNSVWYNEHFGNKKNVAMIYDEPEASFDMSLGETFGMPLDHIVFEESETVEDFHKNLWKHINANADKDIIIYILDSLDSLSDEAEKRDLAKSLKVSDKKENEDEEDKGKGGYGATKAKYLSKLFRNINRDLKKTNCILIIISQIRDDLKARYGTKAKRSGGKALDFYSSHVVWLDEKSIIQSAKYKLPQGTTIDAYIRKNKLAKPRRKVQFDILFEYGADNYGSLIDLSANVGGIKKSAGYYEWEGKKYFKNDLISLLEKDKDEFKKLRKIAQKSWNKLEDDAHLNRKPKWEWLDEPD